MDNTTVDLKSQTMIPLSVEFLLITSAAEINSSPPGRNAMSCTWPKNAEYVDAICAGNKTILKQETVDVIQQARALYT